MAVTSKEWPYMYCVSYSVSYKKGCNSINDAASSIPFLSHEYSKGFFSPVSFSLPFQREVVKLMQMHKSRVWNNVFDHCDPCPGTPAWPLTPNWSCHKCTFTDLLFWLSLVKINLSLLTCWQKKESCRRRRRGGGGRTRRKRRRGGRRGERRGGRRRGGGRRRRKRRRRKKKRQYTQYKILWLIKCIIVFSSFWALHQPHILTLT